MPQKPTAQVQLLTAFGKLPVTKNLVAQVRRGAHCKAGGLWGASAALLLVTLQRAHKGHLLVLTADDVDSLQLQTDLAAFGSASHVLPREEQDDDGAPDAQTRSERQRALTHFAADSAPLLCGIEAMLQPVATPRGLRRARLELRVGQQLDRNEVLQRAQAAGLRSVPLVLAPGECSVRGDVVDCPQLSRREHDHASPRTPPRSRRSPRSLRGKRSWLSFLRSGESPLDAARMDSASEVFLDPLRQIGRAQRTIRSSLAVQEVHHLDAQLG